MPSAALILVTHIVMVCSTALDGVAVGAMIKNRSWRTFPAFTAYLLYDALNTAGIYFWAHQQHPPTYREYFYVANVAHGIFEVLTFAVIYEIYSKLFEQYADLEKVGMVLLRWMAAILILVGTVTAAISTQSGFPEPVSGIWAVKQMADIVMTGLILFLFAFASYFKLAWTHYLFAITAGLGLFMTGELAATAVNINLASRDGTFFTIATNLLYISSCLVWVRYLATTSEEGAWHHARPQIQLAEWNRALEQFLH